MMDKRDLLDGVCLIGIAFVFGVPALYYPIGDLARAEPGMFPLFISFLLLLVGIATVIRARLVAPNPMNFNLRNVGLILGIVVLLIVWQLVKVGMGSQRTRERTV